jgi:hypothetical protein
MLKRAEELLETVSAGTTVGAPMPVRPK